jgi:polyisoprenyl-teichoic acid--peptidoglycan teichoic acid transferase
MSHNSTTHSRQRERGATNSEGISITDIKYSRIKRKILCHVTLVRVFIIFLILGILYLGGLLVVKGAQALNAPLYFNTAYNFITAPVTQLASYGGRTNILVMGKSGDARDGSDLTDTMMLFSISLTNKNVKIVSIPRDTWIPEIRAKINSAYYWGNKKNQGGGIIFAKAITAGVVGVPIQYGAVINFSGFKDIIDQLGGIEVNVENAFTDYYYPIAGKENDTCNGDPELMCRYETVTFNAGNQLMNGETALKFVRSRHGLGIEGTDVAREARQGKVINAVKNKLLDKKTFTNPLKDLAILKVVLNSIQTDIDYPTAGILARLTYDARNSIDSYLIPAELMFNPPILKTYDMQSVFIPVLGNGKWNDINKWIAEVLK